MKACERGKHGEIVTGRICTRSLDADGSEEEIVVGRMAERIFRAEGHECAWVLDRRARQHRRDVIHVARLAGYDVGGLVALEAEHDWLRRAGHSRRNVNPRWSRALA